MGNFGKTLALVLVLVFLTFLAIFQPTIKAQTKTIVVPNDYSTIQAAIENSIDGDTIFVKSGTYQENPINTTKSISIIGEGSKSTIIHFKCPAFTGDIYGFNITYYGRAIDVNANNFTLSGLAIDTNGGDIRFNGNNTTITDNKTSAPFYTKGNNEDISNNIFLKQHFNEGYGINTLYEFNLDLVLSVFSNNVVSYDNNMVSISIGGKYDVIVNNTISGGYLDVGATPCFMSSNKISNSLSPLYLYSDNSVFTNNIIEHESYGFNNVGSNNIIFANQIVNSGNVYREPEKNYVPEETGKNASIFYGNNFIASFRPINGLYVNKIDSFDNGSLGNYWSNYSGTDSNGDGIGETSCHVYPNGTDFCPLKAPFNITAAPDLMPNWVQNLRKIALAQSEDGTTLAFMVEGNMSCYQISSITISVNQSTSKASLSFVVTGEKENVAFTNLTIPKSAIPFEAEPKISIDGIPAQIQGYTQDTDNYYMWYTTNFSTQKLTVTFTTAPSLNSLEYAIYGIVVLSIVSVVVLDYRRYNKTKDLS
jgi:hypothetical protein